jgi:hypothetical protein
MIYGSNLHGKRPKNAAKKETIPRALSERHTKKATAALSATFLNIQLKITVTDYT